MYSKKKLFSKNHKTCFSTLDHDLYICGTCCNYFLCSLDPGESIDNNYSITQPIKTILTQEKHIFSVLSKSNVDEAQNGSNSSRNFYVFLTSFATSKLSGEVKNGPN